MSEEQKEQDYISTINGLQKQLDECIELLEKQSEYIDELKVKIALRDSSFSKKGPTKVIKEYEDKITKLEHTLDLFSVEDLESKQNEMQNYFKRTVQINSEISKLKEAKKVRPKDLSGTENELYDLQDNLIQQYLYLASIIEEISNGSESIDVESFINAFKVIPEILRNKNARIREAEDSNKKLRDILNDFSSSGESLEDLRRIIESKDKEIEAYKIKLLGIEHDICKQQ